MATPDISIFFFNDTATTEIYTLSLHDALPISRCRLDVRAHQMTNQKRERAAHEDGDRSKQHERHEIGRAHSELQSQSNLVCRLLLEKKKKNNKSILKFIQSNNLSRCHTRTRT